MRFSVAVVVVAVILGYLAYEPFPEDLEEPWKARIITCIIRLATAISQFTAFVGYDQYSEVRLRKMLQLVTRTPPFDDADLEIADTTFDSVKVRVYKPKKAEGLLPGMVFIHGGGWVTLSLDHYDEVMRQMAKETNVVVASVDYRLAPEYPFPIPFEDCYTALKHFLKNAKQYGADPTKVGVAGDSAGGNLAAAVSQRLHREKHKSLGTLKFVVLIYPTLQAINFKLPAMSQRPEYTTPLLKTRMVATYWLLYNNASLISHADDLVANRHVSKKLRMSKYYTYVSTDLLPEKYRQFEDKTESGVDEALSQSVEKILINPDSSPLMATDLSGLPPSLIVTAEYDPLRDDGLLYGKRLKDAGVKVRKHHERYNFHGFFINVKVFSRTNFKALGRTINAIATFVKQTV